MGDDVAALISTSAQEKTLSEMNEGNWESSEKC